MKQLQRKLARGAGAASAMTGAWTRAFLRPSRLPFVLLGLLVVVAIATWAWTALERTVHVQLRGHLRSIVEAEVEAVRSFMAVQTTQARSVAVDPDCSSALRALVAARIQGQVDLEAPRAECQRALAHAIQSLNYDEFMFVVPHGEQLEVLASTRAPWLGSILSEGHMFELCQQVLAKLQGRVSRPVPSVVPRHDRVGKLRVGVPYMGVGTPVVGDSGAALGVLVLGIEPDEDFTRILHQARFGSTGETYAFDAEGRLLSQSRFDDELRALGLLSPDPGGTSILQVEVRDPGVDLRRRAAEATPLDERSLTRAVQAAVTSGEGLDVAGYRDYRGVQVVGAWRWLPEAGLGIATEVDVAEAYAPLQGLRLAFGVLVAAIGASGLGTLAFMFAAARSDVALSEAERQVESLGQYQLERKLGEGGMGAVFLGHHALLRRPTAIKIMTAEGGDEQALRRFEREVQATCQLSNPHTISVYDYGHTPDGKFFYAMEYLEGLTLGKLIETTGPLSPARAVCLLLQVCESLAEAHAQGLVHRDVKPDNILVCARGGLFDFVKVLDFGLVKDVEGGAESVNLTAAGMVMGTPLYMPPEQVLGVTVDPRADVYAVGCVAYHLLTGSPPYVGSTVFKVMTAHCKDTLQAPSQRLGSELPPELEDLVQACLEKERDRRPASAQELLERLRELEQAHAWTQADAAAWWRDHAAEAEACAGEAAADPTGLSWLGGSARSGEVTQDAELVATQFEPPPPDATDPNSTFDPRSNA